MFEVYFDNCFDKFLNNHMKDSTKAIIVRLVLAICIASSLGLMYFVNIVQKDYVVLTNEDGPTKE